MRLNNEITQIKKLSFKVKKLSINFVKLVQIKMTLALLHFGYKSLNLGTKKIEIQSESSRMKYLLCFLFINCFLCVLSFQCCASCFSFTSMNDKFGSAVVSTSSVLMQLLCHAQCFKQAAIAPSCQVQFVCAQNKRCFAIRS